MPRINIFDDNEISIGITAIGNICSEMWARLINDDESIWRSQCAFNFRCTIKLSSAGIEIAIVPVKKNGCESF